MTRRDTAQRAVDDRGSTTLTTVVLTPVFLVIALMAFQAALWTHARTEARVIARDSAALVARSHADAAATEQSAFGDAAWRQRPHRGGGRHRGERRSRTRTRNGPGSGHDPGHVSGRRRRRSGAT
jgi:hypothetical protein